MKPTSIPTLILICLTIAGCSSAAPSPGVAQQRPTPMTAATDTLAPTAETTDSPIPALISPGSGGSVGPDVTAAPPRLPVDAGNPAARDGWQTFTDPAWGVEVDFPPDWTLDQSAQSATFASPQRAIVMLEPAPAVSSAGDCVTLVNSYGQSLDLCSDAATGLYTATLKLAGGPGVRLATQGAQALDVYRLMLDSLRPSS